MLALVGVPGCLSRAAKSDWEQSLSKDGNLSTERLSKKQDEARDRTEQRMQALRKKTLVSLAWVVSALVFALIVVIALNLGEPKHKLQNVYFVVSVCSFSWGTLGRLGWQEGSFSGTTIFEELDVAVFWLLYWVGTMTGVAALFVQ